VAGIVNPRRRRVAPVRERDLGALRITHPCPQRREEDEALPREAA
jgi:hypothetical protein